MSNEIREAVQMVLTRMETHPDDFFSNDLLRTNASTPRFGWVWGVLNGDRYGLNEAEIDALKQGYDKVRYRKFHDRVLESLLSEPEHLELLEQQGSSLKPPTKLTTLTQGQMAVANRLGLTAQEYTQAIAPTFKA